MKTYSRPLLLALVMSAIPGVATAQTWEPLKNKPSFAASNSLLLTDGTVIVQAGRPWWKLTPDITGSYVNGTWSEIAQLPAGYNPLYYASAVLPDGRVVINGGEYNFGTSAETALGAMYDPTTNKWTSLVGPAGWTQIGDASSVVLATGTYMIGNCCNSQQALLDAATLTWTIVGKGKADQNSEEGWTLLQDGTVLTVDVLNSTQPDHAERYLPKTGSWVGAGDTIVELANTSASEIGPAVLRPDGTVFATGGNGNTSVYHPGANGQTGTWLPGPRFPKVNGQQIDIADGPAALLPSGNVLCAGSPGVYQPPTSFYEYDGTSITAVPATAHAGSDPSYVGRMLILPTGQILYTDGSKDVEVYNSVGAPLAAWAPVIGTVAATLTHGTTYPLSGTQLNGLSQGSFYGDDAQSATNYPLVRITNAASKHVFYCRTHNHSTMTVHANAPGSTQFDVPSNIETGAGELQVVTNGIASAPVDVTVN